MEDSAHRGGVLGPHAAALRAALLQPFLRLNFVTLWVRDQERSRQFFVEKLSFETIVDIPTPEGGRWIVVAPPAAGWLPGTAGTGLPGIALVVPPEGSPEHERISQNTGFTFLTEDVRSLFQEWSRRGVRFPLPPMEPSWGSGQARYTVFEDVDGNSFHPHLQKPRTSLARFPRKVPLVGAGNGLRVSTILRTSYARLR